MNKVFPVLLLASVVFLSGCISTPGQTIINQSQNVDKCSGLNESQCGSNPECTPVIQEVCGVAGDCHDLYYNCQSVKIPVTDCMPFNPLDDPCEMLAPGAYVSSVTGVCEFNDGNACSQMPFKDLAKCKSVCGETPSKTSAEVTQLGNKLEVSFRGYFADCADRPKLFVKEGASWKEVTQEPYGQVVIDNEERILMCDVVQCRDLDANPLEVELLDYNKTGDNEYKTIPIAGDVKIEFGYYQTEQDCNNQKNKMVFSSKEFEAKPDCSQFSHSDCPSGCVVGPSCKVCEDIGCHVEGYNKDW